MAEQSRAWLDRIPIGAVMRPGVLRSLSPLEVDVDGATMAAVDASGAVLGVGERVLVAVHGGAVWIHRSLKPRPQQGTVQAIASGVASVLGDDGVIYGSVPVIAGTALVDDTVALMWGSAGVQAIAGGATDAPGSPTEETPTEAVTPGSEDDGRYEAALIDARATAVRTSRSGAYRTDGYAKIRAYQGHYAGGISADNSGWFFYGSALRADGTAEGCKIRLSRPTDTGSAGSVTFHLRLHTSATVGTSPPSLTADAEKTVSLAWGETKTVELGSTWGQKLLDGDAAGVALIYSGTTDYASLLGPTDSAPLAGQLTIPYQRKV